MIGQKLQLVIIAYSRKLYICISDGISLLVNNSVRIFHNILLIYFNVFLRSKLCIIFINKRTTNSPSLCNMKQFHWITRRPGQKQSILSQLENITAYFEYLLLFLCRITIKRMRMTNRMHKTTAITNSTINTLLLSSPSPSPVLRMASSCTVDVKTWS